MEIPLRPGPLAAKGYNLHCSGVRWLCEPGQLVRANQPIAYFNVNLEPLGGRLPAVQRFVDERNLQVVCATRVAGRLKFDPASGPGGYLSILGVNLWDAEMEVARIEIDGADLPENASQLRLMGLAGRRMTQLVDVHAGLLPGWNSRGRGWWCEAGETPVTLLGLGVCDITGVTTGERGAFLEMFEMESDPTQFIYIPDHPVTPIAPVLFDQLHRTPQQYHDIAADLHAYLGKYPTVPYADDFTFGGIMLSSIQRNPIRDQYDLLTATDIVRTKPADAVLLSLVAEPPSVLRHKKLGFHLHVMRHHYTATGPAVRDWLTNAFDAVPRSIDDIRNDYIKLVDAIKAATGAHVLVFNRMSTSGDEDISSYSAFDAPLSKTLANVMSKELNLALHDVAEGRNVSIIDVDAIAADIGGGRNLPDGVHQSRAMQELLRQEILHALSGLRPAAAAVR